MSIQESKQILRRHGLRLQAKGNWRHDVLKMETSEVIQTALLPEEVARLAVELNLKAAIRRIKPVPAPVLAQPVRTNRVHRVSKERSHATLIPRFA
jgi:hypothetical protein